MVFFFFKFCNCVFRDIDVEIYKVKWDVSSKWIVKLNVMDIIIYVVCFYIDVGFIVIDIFIKVVNEKKLSFW